MDVLDTVQAESVHQSITAGIVAEYNPFHKGHHWMIQMLRRGGVSAVVCVISGNYVQRAEPALMPVHLRAQAAMAGGADLVLRLPTPWAVSSAEGFAQGSVGLLAALGCVDVLAFGAETPEVELLTDVAELLLVDDFSSLIRAELAKGKSYAAARAAAAELLLPGAAQLLGSPNNILAVEYIKALRGKLRPALRDLLPPGTLSYTLPVPLAMPRVGAFHDGVPLDGYASASWLRERVFGSDVQALSEWVPPECMPIYEKAQQTGEMIDVGKWEMALLSRLRGKSALDFALHPGAGDGLESRMVAATKQATSLKQLFEIAKSKRHAHSRVRRLALSTGLNLPGDMPMIPPFAHVLGANERGLALLRRAKKTAHIPLSTSLAKLTKLSDEARRITEVEAAAEDLYALCQKNPSPGGASYTTPASFVLEKNKKGEK